MQRTFHTAWKEERKEQREMMRREHGCGTMAQGRRCDLSEKHRKNHRKEFLLMRKMRGGFRFNNSGEIMIYLLSLGGNELPAVNFMQRFQELSAT